MSIVLFVIALALVFAGFAVLSCTVVTIPERAAAALILVLLGACFAVAGLLA